MEGRITFRSGSSALKRLTRGNENNRQEGKEREKSQDEVGLPAREERVIWQARKQTNWREAGRDMKDCDSYADKTQDKTQDPDADSETRITLSGR